MTRRAIWITGLAGAVLAGGLAALWIFRQPPTPAMPEAAERDAILAYARANMTGGQAVAPSIDGTGVRAVIVTAYRGGTAKRAWRDVAGDPAAAIADAAAEIAGPPDGLAVRVDLTGAEVPVPSFSRSAGALRHLLDPGIDGLVHRRGRFAFAGPSDAVELSLQAHELADRVAQDAGFQGRVKSPARFQMGRVLRFRAASFVEGTNGSLVISRGNVLPPWPPLPDDLREAVRAGGVYLAGKQDATGLFNYLYDPVRDRPLGGYNLLRHCGTAMSLFQAYGLTKDERMRVAGDRALTWAEKSIERDANVPGANFLREGQTGEIKLGAMGLAILAMLAQEEHAGGMPPERAELARGLGRAILFLQKPSGELKSYHGPNPRRSIYYPGEATLALVRLHRWDGDETWLTAAKRSAEFQATARWTWGGLTMYVPPDAWGAQALEELWRVTKDDRYAKWAYVIGDEILRMTYPSGANVPPDLIGATLTGRAPRVTPTSSRNEAIVALARLARDHGDAKRAKRYRDAAVDAAWYSRAQQYRPENVYWLKNPEAALGGIRESVIHPPVQIDGVQHALTAFLGVADLLEAER